MFISALPSYLNRTHGIKMPPNQDGHCILLVYLTNSSVLCSCYLLITMTFERFYSIIWPLNSASFNTVKMTRVIIVWIFVFCFSYSMPFLFITESEGTWCILNKFASVTVLGEFYYWLTQILFFIFPFSSLLTMNSVIIHSLRKRSKLNLSEPAGQGQTEGQSLRIKQSENQVFTMLLLVTFVYLILAIAMRASQFYINLYKGNTSSYYANLHLLNQVAHPTFYANHAINFFLRVMSGKKFRTDLKNLFFAKSLNKNWTPYTTPNIMSLSNNS